MEREIESSDYTTFNNGMTNTINYTGDYTVGLTRTEGTKNDKGKMSYSTQSQYNFSYNATSKRLICETKDTTFGSNESSATESNTDELNYYFDGGTETIYKYDYTASSKQGNASKVTEVTIDGTTIAYSDFQNISWLPNLLDRENGTVPTVSSSSDITDFVVNLVGGVEALGTDASALSTASLTIKYNKYCEYFVLEGSNLTYQMAFATSAASNISVTYPSFTSLDIEMTSGSAVTTISLYISFNYMDTHWISAEAEESIS